MAINPLQKQLDLANFSLIVGSALVGYQVTAKTIDHIAQKNFVAKTVSFPLKIFVLTGIFNLACLAPSAVFLALCVTSVISSKYQLMTPKDDKLNKLPDFMHDLVEEAKTKECPYSGYDHYIFELEVILNQKEKNNGILAGPAGIGKSAIFETIAWKIAHNKIDNKSPFFGKRLIGINVADIVAGTNFRGQLEERVNAMLDLAKKDPSVVYVIDEIHKILGAGSTSHSSENSDVANQLKPALARNGLKVLGATTLKEYIKYIEADEALARRFKKVDVREPKPRECLEMLRNRRDQGYYNQGDRKVTITDDAFKAAIFFTKRDLKNRFLPDVANDLIDAVRSRALLIKQGPIKITLEDIVKRHSIEIKKYNVETLLNQFKLLIEKYSWCFTRDLESAQMSEIQ